VVDLLEASLDFRVARVLVRMKFAGELAVGFLYDVSFGVLGDAEDRIQVFGHRAE
jgi:hypothetical protein